MRSIYCLLAMLIGSSAAFATHFIGGYIRATPVAGQSLTYQITVTMYFNGGEGAATEGLYICFGDNGNSRLVNRSSSRFLPAGPGVSPEVLISEYTTTYAFSGPGVYTIQTTSANRSNTINTGSAQQPFSLRTTFQIGVAMNRTPILSLPATGLQVSLNQRLALSLAAADADGDSLTYSLTYPL
ncbi:MAG TPA: T9SS C-terminal target domain-containing protein, partial [Fibrella sp.]